MDLTDAQWAVLEPLFRPKRRADGRGRPWQDTRAVLSGVLGAMSKWCIKRFPLIHESTCLVSRCFIGRDSHQPNRIGNKTPSPSAKSHKAGAGVPTGRIRRNSRPAARGSKNRERV